MFFLNTKNSDRISPRDPKKASIYIVFTVFLKNNHYKAFLEKLNSQNSTLKILFNLNVKLKYMVPADAAPK